MNSRLKAEVCILGAGPAGSAISRRLAQLGHSVVVIEKCGFPRSHVGESLVGSILPLLEVLGLRTRVEAAVFLRPEQTIVRWAGDHDLDRPTFGEPGFQVDRGRFDKLLLDAAVECGASLLQPAHVLDICQCGDGWQVDVSLSGRAVRIESNFLVDATGRVNLLRGKKHPTSAPMLALWAYWRNTDIAGAATRVESGASEWFWGAPLPDGTFNASVFLSPCRYREGIEWAGSLSAFYESLLASSELLRRCLSGIRASTVSLCDATCYLAEEIATPNTIKVGEAAFTIDPLSSQGVQTSIGTALHAAVVLHTIAQRPEHTRLALHFYDSRQRQAVSLHRASAASFYAQAAEFYGTDFWLRRAIGSQGEAFETYQARRPAALPEADSLIQMSRDTQITNVPCLMGDYIIEARGVTHSNLDSSLVFVENTEAALLLEGLTRPVRVRELMQRWIHIIGPDSARRVFLHFWNTGVLCGASDDQATNIAFVAKDIRSANEDPRVNTIRGDTLSLTCGRVLLN